MIIVIGVPKEIKIGEKRVGLTPDSVKHILSLGKNCSIIVEKDAGIGSGFSNSEYRAAGAKIVDPKTLWKQANIIVKVKEPIKSEYLKIKQKIIYGYFHFNSPNSKQLCEAVANAKALCIPYEDIIDGKHRPCLAPMSVIAGRLAAQKAAQYLESIDGKGMLMGGSPGVRPAHVLVVGGGVSGLNAALVAKGMGADVTIADINRDTLLKLHYDYGFNTAYASELNLSALVSMSDVVIGAVLVPGKAAPKIITEKMLNGMSANSVVIDIAIDEGGCTAWSEPTTHKDPIFKKKNCLNNDIIFYCVTNMPALAPVTATKALNDATVPYLEKIIDCVSFAAGKLSASYNLYESGISSTLDGVTPISK